MWEWRRALIFLFLLTATFPVQAANIDFPRYIEEGSAALIRIRSQGESVLEWRLEFLGREYQFFREGDDAVSLVAVPLRKRAGREPLYFYRKGSGYLEYKVFLEIRERSFPERMVVIKKLTKEELKRYEEEQKEIRKVTSIYSLEFTPLLKNFREPLGSQCFVTAPFGEVRTSKNSKTRGQHRGVDCAAKEGDPVYAIGLGIVRRVNNFLLEGLTVVIDHGYGVFSFYMHLSAAEVVEGDKIEAGMIVGRVGSSGRSRGAHLHFAVKVATFNVDPLKFLELGGPK